MLAALTALALRLAFPSKRAVARLEIRPHSVTFVPRRSLLGEETAAVAITPQSTELLLCHRLLYSMHEDYAIIVRGLGEPERELRVEFPQRPNAQFCRTLAEGMAAITGLLVRQVVRRRSQEGTVEESPWTPAPKASPAKSLAVLSIAVLPYAAGIATGWVHPRVPAIVATGVALWLCQLLAILAYARRDRAHPRPSLLHVSLRSALSFGAAYGLAVLVGALILPAL